MSPLNKIIFIFAILSLSSGMGILTYDRFVQKDGVTAPDTENKEAMSQLREAEEYLRQNTTDSAKEAFRLFNKVLSLDLDKEINQMARYGIAVSLEKQGDVAASLAHLRILKNENVENHVLDEKVNFRHGKILLSINHVEEGRAILDSVLFTTKDDTLKSDIHTAFGFFFSSRGSFGRARENFDIALKYNPENLQAELGRAEAYKNIKRSLSYDYYDDYFLGNSRLNPEERKKVYSNLKYEAYDKGITAYRSGRYNDAVYFLSKSIDKYTDANIREKSLYWLGESYLASGKRDKAARTFSRVLKNSNSSMDQPALIKMGILDFQKGSYESAARSFQNAVQNYPGDKYSDQAKEWLDESMKMIEDKSTLENYSR
ncbi:MAG: tetratricopeptide repeat protein [Spirochaetia bacterium]|nr:tetratricopeptide repeat protein [Spirochaetia bacterium]